MLRLASQPGLGESELSNKILLDQNSLFSYQPFDEIIRPFNLNEFTHLGKSINQLEKNNNCLYAFIGLAGSGKTCLSFHLSSNQRHTAHRIVCSEGTKMVNMVKFCFHQQNVPMYKEIDSPTDLLLKFCDHLREQNQNFRLVLDQAEKLPLETLAGILHIQTSSTNQNLSFVLIGLPCLKKKISQITQAEDIAQLVTIDIPSLTFKQSQHYIKSSLERASNGLFKRNYPFWLLLKIHRLSQGNPGKINRYCTEYLLPYIDNKTTSSKKMPYVWFLLSSMAMIIFLWKGSSITKATQNLDYMPAFFTQATRVPNNIEALPSHLNDTTATPSTQNYEDLSAINESLENNKLLLTALMPDLESIEDTTIPKIENKDLIRPNIELNTSVLPSSIASPLEIEFSHKIKDTLYTIELITVSNKDSLKDLYLSLQKRGYPIMIQEKMMDNKKCYALTLGIFPKLAYAKNLVEKLELDQAIIVQIPQKS